MTLESLLNKVYDLPSIPKVVQDLITNFSSNTANAASISRNIHADPVIAAKVLRLANSVRYGAGRKIASLDTAVVILGFDALKTLVVASGVTSVMAQIPGLDMKVFWRRSFLVANLCKVIAKNGKELDAEIAFTCGMLHNIGLALMYLGHTDAMKELEQTLSESKSRTALEHDRFGYTDTEVSSRLAQFWHFPPLIQDALLHQENPLNGSHDYCPYAAVINLAVHFYDALQSEAPSELIIANSPSNLIIALNLNIDNLYDQINKMHESEDDIEMLLAA